MKDKCIMCGNDTAYDQSTHIDMRVGYIEGAGQLCEQCTIVNNSDLEDVLNYVRDTKDLLDHLKLMTVPVHIIKTTPNDQELGAKIRKLYYENKEVSS